MILLGEYEELAPGMGFPSMKDFLQDAPYERQSSIVDYLNSGNVHMVTATTFTDVFTGERVKRELVYMDDGVYSWSSKLPYYVAKYNLCLPAAFEAHVLSQKQSLITELRKHMGMQATILTQDHRTFSGKINDYFYPEDNECGAESIVLCVGKSINGSHYIEFYEKDICRIYIHQGETITI